MLDEIKFNAALSIHSNEREQLRQLLARRVDASAAKDEIIGRGKTHRASDRDRRCDANARKSPVLLADTRSRDQD